jgi:hypothetical protein
MERDVDRLRAAGVEEDRDALLPDAVAAQNAATRGLNPDRQSPEAVEVARPVAQAW